MFLDYDLNKRYENVHLSPELREMYADLIQADEATLKTFLVIAKYSSQESIGITISQITDLVSINRKEKHGHTFETTHKNITRKYAERVVDKLLLTGLCYYYSIPPSKVIRLTTRGSEVLKVITKRMEEKMKGEKTHVQE